jgi:hypothetical protein
MKIETKLARVFSSITQSEEKLESTAAGLFAIVKDAKVRTVNQWDKLVHGAYEANGWNGRQGRPNGGEEKKESVPGTVRTYATIVRQAIRSRLKVATYDTFTALRADLSEKRTGSRSHRGGGSRRKSAVAANAGIAQIPKGLQSDFTGVAIEQPDEFKLSLFHDLGALYLKLPAAQRPLYRAQLQRVFDQYKGRAIMKRVNGEKKAA